MEKHYGQIVEYRVRKNGYSISELAKGLQVNRRSIYNWFNQRNLKKDIILSIGCLLRHDFSEEIPEMFSPDDFNCILYTPAKDADTNAENEHYKNKYVALLEQYNQLLVDSL
ncbi:helix-turn-helix domain-containing protein [Mucilaginibacter psychrotolerans]|uniref:XRE family transcriptional regulator n=1 Tax=Mucilaginibacter psychrotolerans TaxID=1524096 RepID=A0A4Y8SLX5_9SPHI|nr:helix-turn-helix transcriptional regulator [Mucilaginibacter psychrotolerans]TFF39842.1 XRE family transcriptional regulator [Mucilaginibacter psychrotolerans]